MKREQEYEAKHEKTIKLQNFVVDLFLNLGYIIYIEMRNNKQQFQKEQKGKMQYV